MSSAQPEAMITAEPNDPHAPIRGYVEAWNRHDIAALGEVFAENAEWINIVGMHWRGKDAIVRAHDVYHRSFFRTTALNFTGIDLRPVTSDVAIAVITIEVGDFTPPDGKPRIGTQDRLSLVIAKRQGAWLIVHGHNTVVERGAERFDPVNRRWDGSESE